MYSNVSIIAVAIAPIPAFMLNDLFSTKTKLKRNKNKEKRR